MYVCPPACMPVSRLFPTSAANLVFPPPTPVTTGQSGASNTPCSFLFNTSRRPACYLPCLCLKWGKPPRRGREKKKPAALGARGKDHQTRGGARKTMWESARFTMNVPEAFAISLYLLLFLCFLRTNDFANLPNVIHTSPLECKHGLFASPRAPRTRKDLSSWTLMERFL
ncbi:hypothetical protein LY76DRAFT_105739 [Colletotrichum caudatum]|nr:hypothetical protein LY76DRAFT_105739 [Colletotrichum caudatum]